MGHLRKIGEHVFRFVKELLIKNVRKTSILQILHFGDEDSKTELSTG